MDSCASNRAKAMYSNCRLVHLPKDIINDMSLSNNIIILNIPMR